VGQAFRLSILMGYGFLSGRRRSGIQGFQLVSGLIRLIRMRELGNERFEGGGSRYRMPALLQRHPFHEISVGDGLGVIRITLDHGVEILRGQIQLLL